MSNRIFNRRISAVFRILLCFFKFTINIGKKKIFFIGSL